MTSSQTSQTLNNIQPVCYLAISPVPVIAPAVHHGTVQDPAEAWPPPLLGPDVDSVAVDKLVMQVHSSHVCAVVLDTLGLSDLVHAPLLFVPSLRLSFGELPLHVRHHSDPVVVIPPYNQLLCLNQILSISSGCLFEGLGCCEGNVMELILSHRVTAAIASQGHLIHQGQGCEEVVVVKLDSRWHFSFLCQAKNHTWTLTKSS